DVILPPRQDAEANSILTPGSIQEDHPTRMLV
ncbi:MAG: hypothetical protein K0R60_1631, partial [Microbacterium sp.]|nr:hypothetical protein [Microbacterium sp.]